MFATRSVTTLTLLAGVALSLFAMPLDTGAVTLPPVSGACGTAANPLTGLKFITSTTEAQTSSDSYVNMPETSVRFTQARTGCVVVSFAGEAGSAAATAGVQVPAVLDGATVCEPPGLVLAINPAGEFIPTHAMNFICKGVAAGQSGRGRRSFSSCSDGVTRIRAGSMEAVPAQ